MNIKRVLFAIMCAFLVLTGILAGISVGNIVSLVKNFQMPDINLNDPPTVATTEPTEEPTQAPADPTGPTEPPHEHVFVKYLTQAAACDSIGWTISKCACGAFDYASTDALGHKMDSGRYVAPTCTEDGCTLFSCTRCKYNERRNVVTKLGHKFTELVQQTTPTCTEDGHTIHSCSNRGCSQTQDVVAPATGHTFGTWSTGTDSSTSCTNTDCDLTVLESELDILSENKTEADGYDHYVIKVGTEEAGCLYTYEVKDYLDSHPTFEYVNGSGLKVSYDDNEEETLALHEDDELVIEAPEEGPSEGGPTEGGSDEDDSEEGGSGEGGSGEGGPTEGGSDEDDSQEGGSGEGGPTEGGSEEDDSEEDDSQEGGSSEEGPSEGNT